ncbi:MAG: T9SS type A sorting domain-containing protein [bacterium]
MIKYLAPLFLILSMGLGGPEYIDGILIDPAGTVPADGRPFIVIDSIPTPTTNYVVGLTFDGQWLWNNDNDCAFFHIDTATGAVIDTFYPTYGNRDMTFDGQYLWAADWVTASINQYDTSDCSIIETYYPPFYAGKPMGMAWDGTHLWVGEESGRIYQMTTTGDTVRSVPRPAGGGLYNPRGLAFDGEYLWVGYQETGIVYKIDTINGNVLESYSSPTGGMLQGLTFDGEYLWVTGGWGERWIYKIDIGLGVEESNSSIHDGIVLNSHPNPFINTTRIYFTIHKQTAVSLSIIDIAGRFVAKPLHQTLAPGTYIVDWRRGDLRTGVYFAVLRTASGYAKNKLIIID